ncbi:hypothetical protein Gotur_024134 [Gossypium turneri]
MWLYSDVQSFKWTESTREHGSLHELSKRGIASAFLGEA